MKAVALAVVAMVVLGVLPTAPARAGDSTFVIHMDTSYAFWLQPSSGGRVVLGARGLTLMDERREDNPRFAGWEGGVSLVEWGKFPRVVLVLDREGKLPRKVVKAIGRVDFLMIDVSHPEVARQVVAQLRPGYAVLPYAPYANDSSPLEKFLDGQKGVERVAGADVTVGTVAAAPKRPRVIVLERPPEL